MSTMFGSPTQTMSALVYEMDHDEVTDGCGIEHWGPAGSRGAARPKIATQSKHEEAR